MIHKYDDGCWQKLQREMSKLWGGGVAMSKIDMSQREGVAMSKNETSQREGTAEDI